MTLGALCAVAAVDAGESGPRRTSFVISAEDAEWWAFQPPKAADPVPPALQPPGSLPTAGPERARLWRRLSFTLTGLPPAPDEVEGLLSGEAPADWLEKKVNEALASPRFGEHWARMWLDAVRYADSDGYKQDAYRPEAWRYRDYVVASFNADKPYDRFVREQLAGDELFPGDPQARIATGFYRCGVYEYNNRDTRTQWANILNETTDTVSDVFLGLGMQCARCHDHKFDSIQQEDYYRLQACFSGMIWKDEAAVGTPAELAAWREKDGAWQQENAALLAELAALEAPAREKLANDALSKFPDDIEAIYRRGAALWTPEERPWMDFVQRQIDEEHRDVSKAMGADGKKQWRTLKDRLAEAEKKRPPSPGKAVVSVALDDKAGVTTIPGKKEAIPAGFLTVLGKMDAPAAGNQRRAALAQWLTTPEHPLTARVLVNRVWQTVFGQGLAATANDFGKLGGQPKDRAILDTLAVDFVKDGWRLKPLVRRLVLSRAFLAPEDTGFFAGRPLRLRAEQIRDAALAASGELDIVTGGPGVPSDGLRRSVFTRVNRNALDPLLASFDSPDAIRSAGARQVTTTPTQSLLMINGQWLLKRAQAMAKKVAAAHPGQSAAQVSEIYRRTYGREAASEEIAEAMAFLQEEKAAALREAKPVTPDNAFLESRELPRHGMSLSVTAENAKRGLFPAMKQAGTCEDDGFTIEAVVNLKSLWPDGRVRTVASRWDGDQGHAGWALGVTGKGSRYTPGTLILQVVGAGESGVLSYQVAASDLPVALGHPWFVSASFSGGTVTFSVKDMADDDAMPRTAAVKIPVVSVKPDATVPVVLASREKDAGHFFDGLIGEVRLTGRALATDQLLCLAPTAPDDVVGHWKFEMSTGPLADSSPARHGLEIPLPDPAPDAELTALADFCHTLLNSSEFLYLD